MTPEFDVRLYRRVHGVRPRGRRVWSFRAIGDEPSKASWSPGRRLLYTEAKAFMAHFRPEVSNWQVLP